MPTTLRKRAILVLAGLCLFFGALVRASVADSLWEEAGSAFAVKNYSEAVVKLEHWIDLQSKSGIRSSEAHYNLGVSYWNLEQPGPAVFQVLQSASLKSNPSRIWQEIQTLSDMESHLNLRDGVSQQFFFRYFLLVGRNIQMILFCLAIWSLGSLTLLVGLHRKMQTSGWLKHSLLWPAAVCLVIAGSGFFNQTFFCNFAVLNKPKGAIALLRAPTSGTPETLVELPSGTIVNVHRLKDDFAEITYPLAGWIPKNQLLPLRAF